ncbi:MAG: TerB family tellurite resistance protein [Bacteroidota bacterium]|jgi:uncharacterized tellurite resistance protein B-like protein|nr:TerB family tellurite resistance protein [Bacteroidota bacterium]
MYHDVIKTQDEALCHLFFHCCLKDGEFSASEIKAVSEKIVDAGLNSELNFKEEIIKYKEYRSAITNETEYLNFLVKLIRPTNELALFSYCIELCLSDASIGANEEALLSAIARSLDIDESNQTTIKNLMVQRKIVDTQKIY